MNYKELYKEARKTSATEAIMKFYPNIKKGTISRLLEEVTPQKLLKIVYKADGLINANEIIRKAKIAGMVKIAIGVIVFAIVGFMLFGR